MILGILGITFVPVIASILAIVLGREAKRRIAADPSLGGHGMATAGIVLGWIPIAMLVLMFLSMM